PRLFDVQPVAGLAVGAAPPLVLVIATLPSQSGVIFAVARAIQVQLVSVVISDARASVGAALCVETGSTGDGKAVAVAVARWLRLHLPSCHILPPVQNGFDPLAAEQDRPLFDCVRHACTSNHS